MNTKYALVRGTEILPPGPADYNSEFWSRWLAAYGYSVMLSALPGSWSVPDGTDELKLIEIRVVNDVTPRTHVRTTQSVNVDDDGIILTYTLEPKSDAEIALLREDLIGQDKLTARGLIDSLGLGWMVERAILTDGAVPVPDEMKAKRAAIVTAQNDREEWLNTATVAELGDPHLTGIPLWPHELPPVTAPVVVTETP